MSTIGAIAPAPGDGDTVLSVCRGDQPELGRGRGGGHRMACPIARDPGTF